MRTAFFLPLLLSGCAQIVKDADIRQARLDVTSDGFARAVFGEPDFIEWNRAGHCQLLERSKLHQPDPPFIPDGARPRPNAGPIRIAAGSQPEILTPQYHGVYRDGERRTLPLWHPGETIVVSAPGASAPPLQIEIPAPPPIVPIDPPAQDVNERGPAIWALRDLPVSWNPVENGTLVVQLFTASSLVGTDRAQLAEGTRRVRCEFDARLGAAIVPQALIGELPVGDAVLYVSSMQERIVDVQGWKIRVRAYTDAIRERHAHIDDHPPTGQNGEE
jgi:hypothetical protein